MGKNYHGLDYALFYMDIHENAELWLNGVASDDSASTSVFSL